MQHEVEGLTLCGPPVLRMGNGQVNNAGATAFLSPHPAGDFLAPEQVMLYTGKNAAPVNAKKGPVNDAADLDKNPVAGNNSVVYQTE